MSFDSSSDDFDDAPRTAANDDDDDVAAEADVDRFFVAQRQARLAEALGKEAPATSRWRSSNKAAAATTTTPAKDNKEKASKATPEFALLKNAVALTKDKRKLKQAVDELTLLKQHFAEVDAECLEENDAADGSAAEATTQQRPRATTPV